MQRRHRRAHRAVWLAFCVLLPALFVGAMVLRVQRDAPPVRLAPP